MLMSGSPTADIQVGAFFAVGSARQAAAMAARGPPAITAGPISFSSATAAVRRQFGYSGMRNGDE